MGIIIPTFVTVYCKHSKPMIRGVNHLYLHVYTCNTNYCASIMFGVCSENCNTFQMSDWKFCGRNNSPSRKRTVGIEDVKVFLFLKFTSTCKKFSHTMSWVLDM